MSVKLEWEIKDDETPLPDEGPLPETQPRGRRRWQLFALVTLVALIGLSFLGFRMRQNQKETENELRAVAEVELSALVNADRDLFLNQQDPDDQPWRQAQEKAFDRHQQQIDQTKRTAAPPAPEHSGEVPDVRVLGNRGWALVEFARDQDAWREMWFYRWSLADGWRRARPREDWLGGKRQRNTPHLAFSYYERDEAIVDALADEMESWHATLTSLYPCESCEPLQGSGTPLLNVEFVYHDPVWPNQAQIKWDKDIPFKVLVPSPQLDRLPADGGPSSELRRQMSGYLVEALIWHQTGMHPNEPAPGEIDALRRELSDWVTARLAPTVSTAEEWTVSSPPLLNALVARDGVQVVPQLVANLKGSPNLDRLLATVGIEPPDPTTRFASLLNAERQTLQQLDPIGYESLADPQADREWREYRANQLLRRRDSAEAGESDLFPPPPAAQVRSVRFNGEIAWVEAEFTPEVQAETGQEEQSYRQVYFFRQTDDGWLFTSPDPAYFGERRVAQTENLVLHYFERDQEWYGGATAKELQTVFEQAAADLGVLTAELAFTIEIEMQPGFYGWLGIGLGEQDTPRRHRFTSPRVSGWRLPSEQASIVAAIDYSLIEALAYLKTGQSFRTNFGYPGYHIRYAVSQWELGRLFPEWADSQFGTLVDVLRASDLKLEDLWREPSSGYTRYNWELISSGFRTLVEYLAETYGPAVIPTLLENLSQTQDLDEWLRLSTGHGLDEIAPAWREWVLATYAE
jgi:hypothetical protein